MTLNGRVLSFDAEFCWGEVGYDLEVLRFHSTSFQCDSSRRHPRVGETVEIVLNDAHRLLIVRGK